MTPVAPQIEAFLRDNLSRHRGASQHTCDFMCTASNFYRVRGDQTSDETVVALTGIVLFGTGWCVPRISGGHTPERARDTQRQVGSDKIVLSLP